MSPRNLVPWPLFKTGDRDPGPWFGPGVGVDDRADTPTGARIAWSSHGTIKIPLGFTYEPGTTYYIAGTVWVATAAFYDAWVSPGDTILTPADWAALPGKVQLKMPSGFKETYFPVSGTFTTPPLGEWVDAHGTPGEVAPNAVAHLCIKAKQLNGAFAFFRLDRGDGTAHPDYFDGDTVDNPEWVYAWDGTPRESTSTAISTTAPDPDPEATATSVTVTPTSITEGESATLTANVTPASATGTATFTIGADSIPVTVSSGVAATQVTITEAGEYQVTVTFTPVSEADYLPSSATASLTVLAEVPPDPDPDPGPDPDPHPDPPAGDPWDDWDVLGTRLAPRVAAYVGRSGDVDTIATAEAQVPIVTEYVRGYTRGNGFAGTIPEGPLRAVIVSGVARLATNPEQVSVFTTGDYSERPAQLAGWTLTELGVLHRYRRTSA